MNMSENNTNTGKYKIISGKNNTFFANNRMMEGSSIPTEGTFQTGDIIVNNGPTAVDEPMWICNEGGTPGKWGLVSNTNTTIVPSYAAMLQSKANVGSMFYVIADESEALEDGTTGAGFYIITTIKENENGKKVPATWDKLNKKESTIPRLTYDPNMPEGTKIYITEEDELIVRFNFSSNTYGDGKYRAYRDGTLIKSWSGAKGNVIVNLGKIEVDGTFNISITATDYLTIPAPETLNFKVIVGGLKLNSTFDRVLVNAIYEEGDFIEFPYTVKLADASQSMKLKIEMLHEDGSVFQEEVLQLEGTMASSIWESPILNQKGTYTLTAQAFTGESVSDETEGTFLSGKLTYFIRVLEKNEIAIIDEYVGGEELTNDVYFSIPFRILSKISDFFVMKGEIYRNNEDGTQTLINQTSNTGISTKVNVTNYWSVGKLEVGSYTYIIKGYTVDGGVESDPVETTIEVVQSTYQRVSYVNNSNLIAYFDANNKRNNDGKPEVWENSSKFTGDKYKILLHGLNYKNNGWKHIDESLSDDEDGEMMLKFTGESYGEMVQMVNGVARPYSPFSIFKSGGSEGITIETAIRTRNIGELNTRVLTCMKSDSLADPGVAISYDTMAVASNSQVNKLEFVEDEWVHITFVVDRNIRTLNRVGQNMIEDVNPTYTLRIYINGVLCSCSTMSEDDTKESLLDASFEAYPLVLNGCRLLDNAGNVTFGNFGECEIKFIRIYNSYLKSSEVLQNYISHIYDIEEQKRVDDKNNTDLATMPTIVFKRKVGEKYQNNASFARLHSIKNKAESKKTFVDCVMEYNDGAGNIHVYNNIDVYLQGTSSLQYPVKNYKIKAWVDEEKTSKLKFTPPGKDDLGWVNDSTYTLKCDYMEQSHKNNTPTARFYNQVIDALGGESPAKKDGFHDAIDGFPCIVYYNEGEGENVLVGSFMFNIDKEGKELGFECDLYDEYGEVVGNGKDSCLSFEATANASDTAGCFYKLEESIENVYNYYIEDSYKEYLLEYGLSADTFTIEQFKLGIADGTISYLTFEEFKEEYDEIDYIKDDFEARYSFNEDDDEVTYRPMVNLVNWVSDSIKDGTFKKDFNKHFDLTYMLAYYLQMQVFTQVDNCGKNSMWDTWDGIKFYPRPYDMDTQMGLSNTGTEIIRVDSEILRDMSPTTAEGTFAGSEHVDTTTDLRYMNYNTRTSKLWNAFAKEFKTEIRDAYIKLRSGSNLLKTRVYEFDNIYNAIKADTDDMIGEIYFNKDASSKYLSQTTAEDSTYLQMLHGNRAQKYKKFLKERIIFLDTVFGYEESSSQPNSLNSYIGLRSDAAYGQGEGTTIRCYLGISVYSPQYVTITVGSGADATITAYVGPESRYIDPNTGMEYEGTLFSFPIRGINKEFGITGAGNIKQINGLQSLNLTEARIEKALKMVELDFSYASRMSSLKVGNNKYLRHLNCRGSQLLGTATESQTLDLTNCRNLKTIDLAYTKFTGVLFPVNNNINSIDLTGCAIKNISIDGAEVLHKITITDCENINKFELNNCNGMETIDVSSSTIQNFVVTNCENVKTINVSNCKMMVGFDLTNSYNVETLNMKDNNSAILQDLQLYSMYNLKKLIASNNTSAHTLRLPKYLNEEEAFKAAAGEDAILWNGLTYLDISNSSIQKIQYGSAEVEGNVIDMSQLTKLKTLNLQASTSMTEIKNITFKGNLVNLFRECRNLATISGTITNTTSSIENLFYNCRKLNNIDNLTFDFTNVTSGVRAAYSAASFKTPMAVKLLKACGSSLTNAYGMFYMYECQNSNCVLGSANDTTRTIPSNMFEFNTSINNINYTFCCTNYTNVPGDLFNPMKDTLVNADGVFCNCKSITKVGSGLFKNKPKLSALTQAFTECSALKNYIDVDPNIFEGSPNITDLSHMFKGCNALISNQNVGLGEMFYPLVNLKYARYMFICDGTSFNPKIPNGLLSKNVNLRSIEGMFHYCTAMTKLPDSLFRVNLADTNSLPNLTAAKGVFGGCKKLAGVVSAHFFLGAENLTDVGSYSTQAVAWSSGEKYPEKGFFEDTKITGYHENFLRPLTKATAMRAMFRNCTALKYCYYYEGNEERTRNNSVSPELLLYNTSVSETSYLFYGCSLLEGCIPHTLFDGCKKTLTSVSNMFNGCSNLTGYNSDSVDGDDAFVGVSSNWFKDAKALNSVRSFIQGCSNFDSTIPEDLFSGCVALQRVDGFFSGCTKIKGEVPRGLFDDCRSTLNDVNHLFANTEISGNLPTGVYEEIETVVGYTVVPKDTEGALQVVEVMEDPFTQIAYSDVLALSPGLATIINGNGNYYVTADKDFVGKAVQLGLLSECLNLSSTANMFDNCKKLTGAIPHDLFFTGSTSRKYNSLTSVAYMFSGCTGLNEAYVDDSTGISYLFKPGFFDKCPNLTDISYVCNYMIGMTSCEIHPLAFDKQTKLVSAEAAFLRVSKLTGGISQLFRNSLGTLQNAKCLFAYTNINNVGANFLNNGGVNKKLKYVQSIFQGCSGLSGTSPEFWNPSKFTTISSSQAGFWGALYKCTNLSNYTTASNINAQWVTSVQI